MSDLSRRELSFPNPAYNFHLSDDCLCFMSYSNSPKVIQVYSKGQASIVLDEVSAQVDNPATRSLIERDIASSLMPEESENPPNVIDGSYAMLLVSVAVYHCRMRNSFEAPTETVVSVPADPPWKYNSVNN